MANEQRPKGDDDPVQVIDGADAAAPTDSVPQDNEQVDTGEFDAAASDEDVKDRTDDQPLSNDELLLSLEKAQAKAEDNWNQLLRAKADMANMQRRAERELENAHKYGLEKMVRELLPIKDSLEMGLAAVEGEGEELDPVKVREGMEMTVKMLADAVAKFGVSEIDPLGEPFNPDFHQAMTTQPGGDGVASNTVLTVFQKGYLLNDRLIRPAMVVVAK